MIYRALRRIADAPVILFFFLAFSIVFGIPVALLLCIPIVVREYVLRSGVLTMHGSNHVSLFSSLKGVAGFKSSEWYDITVNGETSPRITLAGQQLNLMMWDAVTDLQVHVEQMIAMIRMFGVALAVSFISLPALQMSAIIILPHIGIDIPENNLVLAAIEGRVVDREWVIKAYSLNVLFFFLPLMPNVYRTNRNEILLSLVDVFANPATVKISPRNL